MNHNVSRGVACRPVVSRGKWKVGWKASEVGSRELAKRSCVVQLAGLRESKLPLVGGVLASRTMGTAQSVLNRAALWIPPALTATVGLGWTGLMWLYCETAMRLGTWPRPKVDDPKDFLPEVQYQFGWYFVAALAIGSLAILLVLAGLAAAHQKGR